MLDNEDHHHKKGVDIYDERGVLTLRSTEKAAKQCQKGCGIPELINQNIISFTATIEMGARTEIL